MVTLYHIYNILQYILQKKLLYISSDVDVNFSFFGGAAGLVKYKFAMSSDGEDIALFKQGAVSAGDVSVEGYFFIRKKGECVAAGAFDKSGNDVVQAQ